MAVTNVSESTFHRHKRNLLKEGLVAKSSDGKFHPVDVANGGVTEGVTAHSDDPPVTPPPEENTDLMTPSDTPDDTSVFSYMYEQNSDPSKVVTPSDTSGDTQRGVKLSPDSPPLKGGSVTPPDSSSGPGNQDDRAERALRALNNGAAENDNLRKITLQVVSDLADLDTLAGALASHFGEIGPDAWRRWLQAAEALVAEAKR
jgi:hypothetical protein